MSRLSRAERGSKFLEVYEHLIIARTKLQLMNNPKLDPVLVKINRRLRRVQLFLSRKV